MLTCKEPVHVDLQCFVLLYVQVAVLTLPWPSSACLRHSYEIFYHALHHMAVARLCAQKCIPVLCLSLNLCPCPAQVQVGSLGEALRVLRGSCQSRRKGATGVNLWSSRSHSVVTVNLYVPVMEDIPKTHLSSGEQCEPPHLPQRLPMITHQLYSQPPCSDAFAALSFKP